MWLTSGSPALGAAPGVVRNGWPLCGHDSAVNARFGTLETILEVPIGAP